MKKKKRSLPNHQIAEAQDMEEITSGQAQVSPTFTELLNHKEFGQLEVTAFNYTYTKAQNYMAN